MEEGVVGRQESGGRGGRDGGGRGRVEGGVGRVGVEGAGEALVCHQVVASHAHPSCTGKERHRCKTGVQGNQSL